MAGRRRSGFANDRRGYHICCSPAPLNFVTTPVTNLFPECPSSGAYINGYYNYPNCGSTLYKKRYSLWSVINK